MENERGSWGSNIGFLLAAIGSAVGLGNIWGFPYKMGKSGGFTFLIVYLLLALFVGFTIMMAELALGRKTGTGPIGAYHAVSSRFKWIGWLAVFSPFIIMSFYSVLGGYCIEYMSLNLSDLAFQTGAVSGGDLFGSMLTNPWGCVVFTMLFLVICYLINRGGISGGIEKFNNIGMPALFVMLVIIIIKSLSMEGAVEGLKFMFVPGYAVAGGFIESAPSLLFITLQNVFNSMGSIGSLFGVIFYLLVLIAAISSAISLIEVIATFFMDRATQQGKKPNRPKTVLIVCIAILVEGALVAVDGLGSNGVWVPGQSLGIAGWNDCWLDFMDMMSEGLAMPLGALLMSIMIGWEIQPKTMLDEIHSGHGTGTDGFFAICVKFIVPIGMVLVLSGQIASFFGQSTAGIGYVIGIIVCVIGLIAALTSPKKKAALK